MPSDSLEKITQDIFSYLAERFPVCCSSDEFIFFPQSLAERTDWSRWDDLSPESINDAVQKLRLCRDRLDRFRRHHERLESGERSNLSLLCHVTVTLEEQFEHVRHHEIQPSFVLMIATVGLIQALQTPEPKAFEDRLRTLPRLLERFRETLVAVPDLYREAGIAMAGEFMRWIRSLGTGPGITEVIQAAESLVMALRSAGLSGGFRLEEDLLERVVRHHMASGLGIQECLRELEEEIGDTQDTLEREAGHLGYGKDWKSAFAAIESDPIPGGDKIRFIHNEIRRLKSHCSREGFPGAEPGQIESIRVEPLPESLKPVRAADSYSAVPGYPFRGGNFYIYSGGGLGLASETIHPVYRMTVAHEAYPGHHLLDMNRWNNPDAIRRPLEYPLYYEGWACFGEGLMLDSGAFDREYDRLILARRRHRHALRGKVDLLLHMGCLDLDTASYELEQAGFPGDRARQTVRKYALRPAYQLCYTIGHRRFQAIFKSYGSTRPGSFVRRVLEQGEILFEDLQRELARVGNGKGQGC